METTEIKISDVSTLRLQPGDTLVLRTPHRVSSETARRIEAMMTDHFPGHKCLVLERGVELEIVRPGEVD